jgi:hypothetical protein
MGEGETDIQNYGCLYINGLSYEKSIRHRLFGADTLKDMTNRRRSNNGHLSKWVNMRERDGAPVPNGTKPSSHMDVYSVSLEIGQHDRNFLKIFVEMSCFP